MAARGHPEIAGLVDWQPLARGGFSTVWRARQESLDRDVAVKVDHRPLYEDKERRRFLREAGAAGRLSGHPGIVTVHDAGILPDGRPFLVMDLCPGGSLTRWLLPESRRSEEQVRDVGVRIADALAAAHARGVLHRDVKPANILIDSYDHPGLADFGLAALPESGVELSVTLEGMTPAYAPKEVFYLKPPTEFGDVYSLAATLYALLDGKPPRWPDSGTPSLPELLELQREPIERLPQIDNDFMDVLLGAMADDPEERPTAAQFRDQLSAVTFSANPVVPADPGLEGRPRRAAPTTEEAAETPADAGHTITGTAPARAGSRRALNAVLIAAGLVVVVLVVNMIRLGSANDRARVVPDPTPVAPVSTEASPTATVPPSASQPTVSPTKPKIPDGFVDCSAQLGPGSYCIEPDASECWNNYYSYSDIRAIAKMVQCNGYHENQTFVAGSVPFPINQQSQLENYPPAKKLCSLGTLNKVLASGKGLKDWDFNKLPPVLSLEGDDLYRCLVGVGGTNEPLRLKVPAR